MGMMTKSGKYFANPAIGRAHESDEQGGKRGGKHEAGGAKERPEHRGGAHSVHIFVDEAGGHHTVAHHPHGVEHSEHGSLDEAMDHAKGEMGGNDGGENDNDGGDDAAPSHGGLMGTLGSGAY